MIKGVQYVTDMAGKPVAVQIDLRAHGSLWEEFCDALVAKSRAREPHADWQDVKKRIAKSKKPK